MWCGTCAVFFFVLGHASLHSFTTQAYRKTTNTWEGEKNSQMYFVSYLFGFQGNVAPLLQGPLIFPKMYFWLGHSYNKTSLNAYVIDFVHNVYSKEALT